MCIGANGVKKCSLNLFQNLIKAEMQDRITISILINDGFRLDQICTNLPGSTVQVNSSFYIPGAGQEMSRISFQQSCYSVTDSSQ